MGGNLHLYDPPIVRTAEQSRAEVGKRKEKRSSFASCFSCRTRACCSGASGITVSIVFGGGVPVGLTEIGFHEWGREEMKRTTVMDDSRVPL